MKFPKNILRFFFPKISCRERRTPIISHGHAVAYPKIINLRLFAIWLWSLLSTALRTRTLPQCPLPARNRGQSHLFVIIAHRVNLAQAHLQKWLDIFLQCNFLLGHFLPKALCKSYEKGLFGAEWHGSLCGTIWYKWRSTSTLRACIEPIIWSESNTNKSKSKCFHLRECTNIQWGCVNIWVLNSNWMLTGQ